MMSPVISTRHSWKHGLVAVGAAIVLSSSAAYGSEANDSGHFTWSAELVEFDETAKMATMKSLVVGSEMKDRSTFSEGDRVMLTWSGITAATGIRYISHDVADLENARLMMPVEFVSFAKDGRYVTYRVSIPASDWDRIKTLTPGEWVTATSPIETSLTGTTVSAIRAYTDVG